MAENSQNQSFMDKLTALCKRRGFIFQSSEIYGGINGFWDYGPLGVELKRNVKDAWWADNVQLRDDMVGLDCSIIMNPKVWEASGHVVNFNDPLVDCKSCKARFRADQLFTVVFKGKDGAVLHKAVTDRAPGDDKGAYVAELEAAANNKARKTIEHARETGVLTIAGPFSAMENAAESACANCGGPLTDARKFNMMFETFIGAMQDSSAKAYLRPETAQGIFCNYKNVLDTTRMKMPFGIAQIGKSFRNEINPRNYTFRSREFEQMEIEFFCPPGEADKWYQCWRQRRYDWYIALGLKSSKLRLRDHEASELAHYARGCADVEYEFPFGISELEGIANRTDFDLKAHQAASGKDMAYFDEESKERYIPYVIEPSGGVDRATLAFLCEAYCEDTAPDEHGKPQSRTVLRFHPRLAPIKVAVFPLVKKDGMPEAAERIYRECKQAGLTAFYDEKGAVGRRYRRQDEAGTPFCVTVDGQTAADQTVTVRDRDSLKQDRVAAGAVVQYVKDRLRV